MHGILRHGAALSALWFALTASAFAQETGSTEEIVVTARRLDQMRQNILPSLGARDYKVGRAAIEALPQGANQSFNQLLLQTPGVQQDNFGQLHIRDEHGNIQFRINGILLPEGTSGFGQVLDTHFMDNVSVLTGTLPAQYGYRTAAVVDIRTKDGAFDRGVRLGMYGGSHATIQPSFEVSGSQGGFNYYVSGSYLRSDLGIENPTPAKEAIHDHTEQQRAFAYLSQILSPQARVSVIAGSFVGRFEIPNTPGKVPVNVVNGGSDFDSAKLDARQRELTHFALVALQYSGDQFDFQLAPFTRYSKTVFTPDVLGDLIFNGTADHLSLSSWTTGIQGDAAWHLSDTHTLRGGLFVTAERTISKTQSQVLDTTGVLPPDQPFTISDKGSKTGYQYSLYLQDEWKITPELTLNFGGRFDVVDSYTHENQISPRVNLVWKPSEETTLHAGYARYFTPPPQELVQTPSLLKFVGTTKEPAVLQNSPTRSEREHYFDVGIEQELEGGVTLGLDGYYKMKRNLLDEGQFGEALLLFPFNYKIGRVYGLEATANYRSGPFSAYLNLAYAQEKGKQITSSQFNFSPDDLDFIATHAIHTDHDQKYTASGGASYRWANPLGALTGSVNFLFGSGLRTSLVTPDGSTIPNGAHLPSYTQWNLGLVQSFDGPGLLAGTTLRFDVINLFDTKYQIRSGGGIGLFQPSFGPRRAFYAGISRSF